VQNSALIDEAKAHIFQFISRLMFHENELRQIVLAELERLSFPHAIKSRVFRGEQINRDWYFVRISCGDQNNPDLYSHPHTIIRFQLHIHKYARFTNIHLAQSLRGENWGRKFVQAAEQVAQQTASQYMEVVDILPNAVQFWEHIGYKRDRDYTYRKYFAKTSRASELSLPVTA
jgi:hypothetical protein